MNRILAIILATAVTALAGTGGGGRLAKWHLKAVFSRVDEGAAGSGLTGYAFAVVSPDTGEEKGIRRIVVSAVGRDPSTWDEETQKFRGLLEGAQVTITVRVPLALVRRAEASDTGDLIVDPEQIEIDPPGAPTDQPAAADSGHP